MPFLLKIRKPFLLGLYLTLFVLLTSADAEEGLRTASVETQVEVLFAPGRDALDIKLAIDAMVDPSASVEEGRKAVEDLAAALVSMARDARTSHEKLQVLRRFLYVGGPWNGNRPFAYDMSDPLGQDPRSRLLSR